MKLISIPKFRGRPTFLLTGVHKVRYGGMNRLKISQTQTVTTADRKKIQVNTVSTLRQHLSREKIKIVFSRTISEQDAHSLYCDSQTHISCPTTRRAGPFSHEHICRRECSSDRPLWSPATGNEPRVRGVNSSGLDWEKGALVM